MIPIFIPLQKLYVTKLLEIFFSIVTFVKTRLNKSDVIYIFIDEQCSALEAFLPPSLTCVLHFS